MNTVLTEKSLTKSGEESKESLLTVQERETLRHVYRYRFGLTGFVARMPCFSGSSGSTVRSVLDRLLKKNRYLTKAPLYGERKYFYLTQKGADVLGVSDARTKPFKEPEKIRAFAMTSLCCEVNSKREKLTRAEFEKYFPDLYRQSLPMNYYVDLSGESPRLGYVRVDTGGRGRWDRMIGYLRRDVFRHRSNAEFQELIDDGFFELSVVTALEQKAKRLQGALQDAQKSFDGVSIRIHVVPDLLELIAPVPTKSLSR